MAVTPEVRLAVLEAHKCRCVYCGSYGSDSIDHIIASANGGTDDLRNLTAACTSCNAAKRNKDLPTDLLDRVRRHAAEMEPKIMRMLEDGFDQIYVSQAREGKPKKDRSHDIRVNVLFDEDLLAAVDVWVAGNRYRTRNDAIRELIRRGMEK